jgi:hypothetical protein
MRVMNTSTTINTIAIWMSSIIRTNMTIAMVVTIITIQEKMNICNVQISCH